MKLNSIQIIDLLKLYSRNYIPADSIKEFKKFSKNLFQNIDIISKISSQEDNLLSPNLLNYWLKINCCCSISSIINHYNCLELLFKRLKPNLAIYLNKDTVHGRIFNLACKRNNTKLLFIQHASVGGTEQGPLEMDYAFLSGEMARKFYEKRKKIISEIPKIFLTGNPKYDQVYKYQKKVKNSENSYKNKIFKKLNIKNHKRIILLLTNPVNEVLKTTLIKSVLDGVRELDNIQLIIKLHPREIDSSLHEKLVKDYGHESTLIIKHGKIPLLDLISISDIVFGRLTASLIEAAFMDKPVVNLNFDNFGDLFSMSQYNAEITLNNPDKINNTINDILTSEDLQIKLKNGRSNYRNYVCTKFDGKSVQRSVNNIKLILEKEF